MRVLIISHNVFSKNDNMGKTLCGLFSDFDENEISQLYFHSEVPTVSGVCSNYYKISDKDALKAIIFRKHVGKKYCKSDVLVDLKDSRTDKGVSAKAYKIGRKKNPINYLVRDFVWRLSGWFSGDLKKWLSEVRPEVIFFAAGDYSFSYVIANKIANYLGIPVIAYCVDDYYIYNAQSTKLLGKFRHKLFLKTVFKTMKNVAAIVTICEGMAQKYSELFSKNSYVLYTTAEKKSIYYKPNRNKIAYFGSLGLKRDEQLIDIGKAVYNTREKTGISEIDVYTREKDEGILSKLKSTKGVNVHDAVSESEMLNILSDCICVIHTEAFDSNIRQRVKYSISTKIAETLVFGPCLFAYGPEEVASIEYLLHNMAAFVVTDRNKLERGIKSILTDENLRESIIKSAREASVNHLSETNDILLKKWFKEAIDNNSRG